MARRGERYIAGAYAIGAFNTNALNTGIKPPATPVVRPTLAVLPVAAHPAAAITAFTPKTSAAGAGLAAAITAAGTPKPKPAAGPKASAASLAQAAASANKLITAGRRLMGKKNAAAFGQKVIAAGQGALAKANKIAQAAQMQVMGVDWGKVGTTALDFSAYFNTVAGTNDALAAMVDAYGRASDVVTALTAAGQTSAASQGQSILDAMNTLVNSTAVTANADASVFTSADTSVGPKANALISQENYWETKAAPLANMTPGGTPPPGSGAAGAPTITAVSDVSNPAGNQPPQPNPYGGMPTGGANPGDQISITGANLTGATSVLFSGVPAMSFQVVSPTQITAMVPQGAPTGPVTVATPGGTATSTAILYTNAAGAPAYGGGDGGGGFGGGGGGGGGDSGGGGLDDSDIDWGDGSNQGGGGGGDGMDFGDQGGGGGDGADSGDQGGDGGDVDWGDDSDWGDSPSGDDLMGDSRYVVGAQVIGATWDEIVGDAVPHAPFDNTQIYNPGDIASYWGQWWKATRQVLPPMIPLFMKGDVPGGSDAWVPLTAEQVITDVLGAMTIPTAGAHYTDSKTVGAVQAALKEHGFNGKDGVLIVDGVMGPNTAFAIRSLQATLNAEPSGIIDEGVIAALQVTPGVLPPGVTLQQKTAVEVQVALDAATAAEHAITQPDVQAAAAQVAAAAPAEPPELKQEALRAHAAAVAASTPAQVAAAKQQVQAVAQKVTAAVAPGWWGTPLWAGAPVKRWQGVVGGGAAIAVGLGLALVARRR